MSKIATIDYLKIRATEEIMNNNFQTAISLLALAGVKCELNEVGERSAGSSDPSGD